VGRASDRRGGGSRGPGRIALVAALVGTGILVLNSAAWFFYRDARRGLERELARRLEDVAAAVAATLDPDQVARAGDFGTDPGRLVTAADSLRARLRAVADAADLANVLLFDGLGTIVLDAGGATAPPRDALDDVGVRAALAGATAHSPLYQSAAEFLMTGYAPVRDATDTPVGALAVEADARFFAALRRLRFAMAGTAGFSVLVLGALGVLFARAQASLQRAEAAVQRAETLAAMGRMTAGIAHEIRNPLGIIQATAARLKKRYEDPARPDERFDYIRDEVERLNAILTGYLQFAKDEPPRLEPADLVPLVERSLRSVAPELERAHIDLAVQLPASAAVRADAPRLQQVCLNVLLNAVQAMPEGGRITVQMTQVDDRVRLDFTDTGPGIPASVRGRLFEPFVTTKEHGSGLGLVVARRIVEEHGGTIALTDAPSGGTRVEISLPAA